MDDTDRPGKNGDPGPGDGSRTLLLAQLQERSAIIDGALDGIVVIDTEGVVQEFNKAAERMFGFERGEAVGTSIVDLIIPDCHRAQHESGFRSYVAGRSTARMIGRRIETEARRKCGEIFPVELTIIETAGTERPVFAGYLRDLTERREMEAEMERQREDLHQSEKLGAMGALLANVAHELNNPLSVIVGQAELMRELPLDDRVATYTERLLSAANRSKGIVRSLLAAVRQKPPVRQTFNAELPLRAAVGLVEHAFASAGTALDVSVDGDALDLTGDEGQITQVLANLLTNAQHAAPGAAGRVSATLARERGDVVYAIADNGAGVDSELRARIFEPFFTTKEEGVGTGVGLAIARNIATAHDGELTFGRHDELGGAVFELRLPALEKMSLPKEADLGPQTGAASLTGVRVLVVDDDPDVAGTVVELLEMEGAEAESAASGREGLAHLAETSYDLVLSDLRMPGMDGAEFFRLASEKHPETARRFGFITGDGLNSSAAAFLKDVRMPVIEKPVSRTALAALCAEVIRGSDD